MAADLLCEAEHDEEAQVWLVTTSASLAKETVSSRRQLKGLQREKIAAKSVRKYSVVFVVTTIDEAIDVANEIAAEHLTLSVDEPFDYLEKIDMPAHCSWGAIPRLPSRTTSRGRIMSCRPGRLRGFFGAVDPRLYEDQQHCVLHQRRIEQSKGSPYPAGVHRRVRCARQIRPKQVHMKKDAAPRQASLHRATKETDIRVEWTLDGSGESKIDTGIRFRPHAGVDGQAWIF